MKSDKAKFKIEFENRLIQFSLTSVKFCERIRENRNLWTIADQLIKSSTSIGANVIEAKAASSRRDYLKFFQIALKSANETKYWLILITKGYKEYKDLGNQLLQEANELANILASGILTMKGKRSY